MNIEENFSFLKHKMLWEKSRWDIIEISWKICWILLLHSFDRDEKSFEESVRISPEFQWMWFWTTLKKLVLDEVLSNNTSVEKIISRHSAFNKWTFFTNKNCWWNIVDFVANQTFLPNIWKTTDDFKWEICKVFDWKDRKNDEIFSSLNPENIKDWLKKHNFIK
jgi:hypothetical protein